MSEHGPCCSFAGGHSHLGAAVEGETLLGSIDIESVRCLNERQPDSCKRVFRSWLSRDADSPESLLESNEDDPELLLFVPFKTQVRIRSITIIGGKQEYSPKAVRLFVNRDDLDFSNIEGIAPVQELQLITDHAVASHVEYPVKVSKFFNSSNVTLHFPEAQDTDFTQIRYICFRGEATENRRGIVNATYEARAITTDHPSILNVSQQQFH